MDLISLLVVLASRSAQTPSSSWALSTLSHLGLMIGAVLVGFGDLAFSIC
jgi:hypothetical protein